MLPADPRLLRPIDPDEISTSPEVLIAEARARARRRRRIYAVAAVLALAAGWAMMSFGRPGPTPNGTSANAPGLSPPSLPAGAQDAATIVAWDGVIHRGWVLVYGDGRVIGYRDPAVAFPSGGPMVMDRVLERRLTAEAFDLVRSGTLEPMDLLYPFPSSPPGRWRDAEFTPYAPSRFATCPHAVDRLSGQVQALLRRTERPFDVVTFDPRYSGLTYNATCSELSEVDASVVIAALEEAGSPAFEGLHTRPLGTCALLPERDEPWTCFHPVLPHGGWVEWGG